MNVPFNHEVSVIRRFLGLAFALRQSLRPLQLVAVVFPDISRYYIYQYSYASDIWLHILHWTRSLGTLQPLFIEPRNKVVVV